MKTLSLIAFIVNVMFAILAAILHDISLLTFNIIIGMLNYYNYTRHE